MRVPEHLTREQLTRLAVAAADHHYREGLAVLFLYATGARIGEAAEVRPEWDVVGPVGARSLVIRGAKRAAREEPRERTVPLEVPGNDLGGRVLDEALRIGPIRRANTNPALADTLFGVERSWFGRIVKRAAERAGLPQRLRNPHKLRATFATHLLEAGVPVHVVKDLLGHRKVETTMHYAAVTDPARRQAIARLGQWGLAALQQPDSEEDRFPAGSVSFPRSAS
jgi:site-specific recombinase XerD